MIEDTTAMEIPFRYPDDDHISYLAHFAPKFSNVFVAFNPFVRCEGRADDWDPECAIDELWQYWDRGGTGCAVSWARIASLSGLTSPRSINRALRLTGPKRIGLEFANPGETRTLVRACRENGIAMPEEGQFAPPLVEALRRFLSALGHDRVLAGFQFGIDAEPTAVADICVERYSAEICTLDGALYVAIYLNYHYALIAQNSASFASVSPDQYFEGFAATPETTDFWGIGEGAPTVISA